MIWSFLGVTERCAAVAPVCRGWLALHRSGVSWIPVVAHPCRYFDSAAAALWASAVASAGPPPGKDICAVIRRLPLAIAQHRAQVAADEPESCYAIDYEDWEGYDDRLRGWDREVNREDYWKGGGREGEAVSQSYGEWQQAQREASKNYSDVAFQADGLALSIGGTLLVDPAAFRNRVQKQREEALARPGRLRREHERKAAIEEKERILACQQWQIPGTRKHQLYKFVESQAPLLVLAPVSKTQPHSWQELLANMSGLVGAMKGHDGAKDATAPEKLGVIMAFSTHRYAAEALLYKDPRCARTRSRKGALPYPMVLYRLPFNGTLAAAHPNSNPRQWEWRSNPDQRRAYSEWLQACERVECVNSTTPCAQQFGPLAR